MWSGRFTGQQDASFAAFNRSFGFDRRLIEADVKASIAYANALQAAGVISEDEAREINDGLKEILNNGLTGQDKSYLDDNAAEDVHTFIETRLIEKIGDTARKLHTGRSRNDQVSTSLRIWLREQIDAIGKDVREARLALIDLAKRNETAVLPGYTHMQRAQPVLLAHWCLAYFEMLTRDDERLTQVRKRVNTLPLGSAALAGTSYPIDRGALARELGFEDVSRNSLDAVSDRDFCLEFLSASSILMVHLSRLAEDIVIYATAEFGFFKLNDEVATGSSLMPQKKNPDAMELVRGKAGRVFGSLIGSLAVMKGLPLAYNKDMQEDKEALFDAVDTVRASLQTTATVLRRGISVQRERMLEAAGESYMNATEIADYLVRKGMPFREAHHLSGRIVLRAAGLGCELNDLSLEEFRSFSTLVEEDVYQAISLERTLKTKSQTGGTSPGQVARALKEALERLSDL